MSKHKIAILINSLKRGGSERTVFYLLNGLRDRFEVDLILFSDEIEYELPIGQRVEVIGRNEGSNDILNIARIPKLSWRLKNYCRDNDIELVLSLLSRPNFVACFAKKLGLKSKVLISERAYTPMWFRDATTHGKVGKRLISTLYPLADAILPNSVATGFALREHYGVNGDYHVVRNPVDLNYIQERSEETVTDVVFDKFTFVCVAGFRAQKNHVILIDAFGRLKDRDAQLLLIGSGPLLESCKMQVEEMGFADKVLFLGPQENPFKYLRHADCFVLSSNFEGFPNVLLEALACGLPIISADCQTGPRELLAGGEPLTDYLKPGQIQQGQHGILVPVGDAACLSLAMHEMMANDQLRNNYMATAKNKASEYNYEGVLTEFVKILELYLPKK